MVVWGREEEEARTGRAAGDALGSEEREAEEESSWTRERWEEGKEEGLREAEEDCMEGMINKKKRKWNYEVEINSAIKKIKNRKKK